MYDVLYRDTRHRMVAVARGLTADQLASRVTATPDWTVHELLAHVVGVASDVTTGRLDGAISDTWTERHVSERRAHSVVELLAEWDRLAPDAEAQLAATRRTPNMAFDLLCHEGDLREVLGLAKPERQHFEPLLDTMAKTLGTQLDQPGTLEIRDEAGLSWHFGTGAPVRLLRIDGYEVVRAVFSRRSQQQIADWDWDPAPAGSLANVGVFGPREDDQPIPVA